VSVRRQRENREYTKLRREFLESRPRCEFPDCTSAAEQIHHKRGRVGPDYLDVSRWLAICPPHHQHLTEHPAWAISVGLSESRIA
jgi:hypothetical protein